MLQTLQLSDINKICTLSGSPCQPSVTISSPSPSCLSSPNLFFRLHHIDMTLAWHRSGKLGLRFWAVWRVPALLSETHGWGFLKTTSWKTSWRGDWTILLASCISIWSAADFTAQMFKSPPVGHERSISFHYLRRQQKTLFWQKHNQTHRITCMSQVNWFPWYIEMSWCQRVSGQQKNVFRTTSSDVMFV